jgi:hypothetical protein
MKNIMSDDNDDEDITSQSVVPFPGTLIGITATKTLDAKFQTKITRQLLTSDTMKAWRSHKENLPLKRERRCNPLLYKKETQK